MFIINNDMYKNIHNKSLWIDIYYISHNKIKLNLFLILYKYINIVYIYFYYIHLKT
jgi:hypothetical protein